MKYSLAELISQIAHYDNSKYEYFVPLYIREASRGVDWKEWDAEIFVSYFESSRNSVAYLGQGCLKPKHKDAIKKNWQLLAPHLKAIALSQDVPLWEEYKAIKKIARECTEDNMQIAINRMLACLQPKLLCTEVQLEKVNLIFDYIITYTDAKVPSYDRKSWEDASYHLLMMFHEVCPDRDMMDFSYLPWRLLGLFEKKLANGELTTYWINSWNEDEFMLHKYFSEHEEIDWSNVKNNHFNIGDIVYLYSTHDEQKIRYKTIVVKPIVPPEEELDDTGYSKGAPSPNPQQHPAYRLKLLDSIDTEALNYQALKSNGLSGSIRTPRRLLGNLFVYIHSVWNQDDNPYDEITDPEDYYEGAIKKVYVNHYERDKDAREKCIKAKGCRCAVCGMDFEKTYGDLGKGFIHVHHIVPISTIGKEYKIDPIKDLVPVCPNCHAMLHRGKDGELIKVEDLCKMFEK